MPAPTPVVVGSVARRRDTQVPPYKPCRQSVCVRRGRCPHRPGGTIGQIMRHLGKSAPAAAHTGAALRSLLVVRSCLRAGRWPPPSTPQGRAGVSLAAASGSFAPCEARPEALPLETAIWATRRRLARGVGEEFCVRARPSFVAILDVWQEAEPQLWRKRPGDARRHTGGKLPYRKNRVKLLTFCT